MFFMRSDAAAAAGRGEASKAETLPPLLFFSTRQGRQTNCVLTVEVARFVAEKLNLRLVLPACHTSPLGEQACAYRPEIPAQRQILVPFSLPKVLQPRDLARCWRPAAAAAASAPLSPADIPLSAVPRNVTCLEIVARSAGRLSQRRSENLDRPSPCESELSGDDDLRSQLPIRFTSTVTINADAAFVDALLSPTASSSSSSSAAATTTTASFLSSSHSSLGHRSAASSAASRSLLAALPAGQDVFLHNSFGLFSRQLLGPLFRLCALPRETEGVVRMARHLERSLGFARSNTLCVHWRAEDFHHPNTLVKHRLPSNASSGAHVAKVLAARARRLGAGSVLLLTNARYEALHELQTSLRASGLRVESPRALRESSTFGCAARYVYGTMAEMHVCSRMRHFAGSPRSSFSGHIAAMRAAKGLNSTGDSLLAY